MRELSSAPEGHLFELLVPPGAERRGSQGFVAQLAHSPRSAAEGGTTPVQRRGLPRLLQRVLGAGQFATYPSVKKSESIFLTS